jgi:hypothetical protein
VCAIASYSSAFSIRSKEIVFNSTITAENKSKLKVSITYEDETAPTKLAISARIGYNVILSPSTIFK